jgi:CDP-glucose 4,6-dehydratase
MATGWNFGPSPDDAMTVGDVATCACAVWGDAARWRADDQDHPHEEGWLQLDSSAARSRLHWRPKLLATEAVEWTIQWYRDYDRGASARALCLDQIERYGEKGA